MRAPFFGIVCAVGAATAVAAQGVGRCHSISAQMERLSCYDDATGYLILTPSASADSKWEVQVKKSEMTDTTDVYARLESLEPVRCSFSNDKVTLLLRCQENTTTMYISTTGCHLTSSDYNDYGDVTYRLDDQSPRTQSFEESTDNRALGLWTGGRSIPFIKSMFGHSSLLVRFTPFNESPVSARFPITGTEEAVKQLREACKW